MKWVVSAWKNQSMLKNSGATWSLDSLFKIHILWSQLVKRTLIIFTFLVQLDDFILIITDLYLMELLIAIFKVFIAVVLCISLFIKMLNTFHF